MTQRELATAIDKTETSIIYIEGNKTKASLPTLRKLSKVLDLPIHYLGVFEELHEGIFGQRLKKARLYRGLTKAEAAEILGVKTKTVWGWETNLHEPLEQYNEKIADFLSVLNVQH